MDESIAELFMKLRELINAPLSQSEKDILLKALFAQILVCIKEQTHYSLKKDLHIPIHKYLLEKRLILANKKIRNFASAAQAAEECGFWDYSGFYKQYKKMFGISPSKSKAKTE